MAEPAVENETSIACFRKAGFQPVGVVRQYLRDPSGAWRDGLWLDLLAKEFVRD